jgi:hypothetical protein
MLYPTATRVPDGAGPAMAGAWRLRPGFTWPMWIIVATHHRVIETVRVEDALGVAPSRRRLRSDRTRQALLAGSTVESRYGSGLGVPARLVGWSEPGKQAKGGDIW